MHGLPLSFNIVLEYPGFIANEDVYHHLQSKQSSECSYDDFHAQFH